MVRVNRDDVVEMFEGLGFAAAKKWNKKKTLEQLKDLAELAEGDDEMALPGKLGKILTAVVEAKGEVEVVIDEETDLNAKPAEVEEEVEDETEEEEVEDETEEEIKEEKPKKEKKAKAKKEKAEKPKKEKKPKEPKTRKESTKGNLYLIYKDAEDKAPKVLAPLLFEEAKTLGSGEVKINTIRGWISGWNRGKGLPYIAKTVG